MYRSGKVVWPFYCCDPGWSVLSMYRRIYSHANSIRVLMMMMMMIASQEYCTYFLFPPFLVSSAVISSYFLRQSLLFSSPFCGRCMCVSACCGTAAVVHPHDPMTKGRGGCRECQSPVHCGTPLPDVDTFRGTGRCRISQLYR